MRMVLKGWALFFGALIIILGIFSLVGRKDLDRRIAPIVEFAEEHLIRSGITESSLILKGYETLDRGRRSWKYTKCEFKVAPDFDLEKFRLELIAGVEALGGYIRKEEFIHSGQERGWVTELYFRDYPIYFLALRGGRTRRVRDLFAPARKESLRKEATPKAMVAMVVDDLGYNLRYVNELFELEFPMTLGILPKLRYSSRIARMAEAEGLEVMLHLPLEPHSDSAQPGRGAIYTTMEEGLIKRLLQEDLESVPYARGISSHMGSKATEDEALMTTIFEQMKGANLYFLDSLVTTRSICPHLAQELGIRFAKRDVFLDNEDDIGYIKGQFRVLTRVAHRRGKAVGICHLKPNTLVVLEEMIPQLEGEGIKFVYVSELVE